MNNSRIRRAKLSDISTIMGIGSHCTLRNGSLSGTKEEKGSSLKNSKGARVTIVGFEDIVKTIRDIELIEKESFFQVMDWFEELEGNRIIKKEGIDGNSIYTIMKSTEDEGFEFFYEDGFQLLLAICQIGHLEYRKFDSLIDLLTFTDHNEYNYGLKNYVCETCRRDQFGEEE